MPKKLEVKETWLLIVVRVTIIRYHVFIIVPILGLCSIKFALMMSARILREAGWRWGTVDNRISITNGLAWGLPTASLPLKWASRRWQMLGEACMVLLLN